MNDTKGRRNCWPRASLGVALFLGTVFPGLAAQTSNRATPASEARVLAEPEEGVRDPLGTVRTTIRPRVWILFDTSESMEAELGDTSRFGAATEVIRRAVRTLESEAGAPLVHWGLATFLRFRHSGSGSSPEEICADPTMGAGLPDGSPGVAPLTPVRCGGMMVLADPPGCDAEAARTAILERLPSEVNAERTPNGIALYQLASQIAQESTDDLAPGQRNVIVLITDGMDTCECNLHPWRDFNVGAAGKEKEDAVWLRTGSATPAAVLHQDPPRRALRAWNAGLKAKAAYLALNGDDPGAGLGDIHVVGVDLADEESRGYTNHLAWMASDGRHPAIHADRPEALRRAIEQILSEVTLPAGEVKLSAPRLATVKELVASSPSSSFPGSDPTLAQDALVVPANGKERVREVLQRRRAYRDNILLSTSARLHAHRGRLRAFPTSASEAGSGGRLAGTPIWDAGERLADRDPDDRVVLFNRPGSQEMRAFRIGEVTPQDIGVGVGYLSELDGTGARSAEDAVRIVVRLVRGEELEVHPETGTIYGPGGDLHFTGGRGTWKLREGLASPAVVTNPPRHPERVSRERKSYERFFNRYVNRRTMVYLPTSGGLIHAFAGDSGDEVFAYIPDDLLGPSSVAEETPERFFLRDLAVAGVRGAAGLQRDLVNRFALAGSPVVRDVFLERPQEWRTVLAFGRSAGGRFVTALDVSEVGAGWAGEHRPPSPSVGGPGLPRLLFNRGHRPGDPGGSLDELGASPEPLLAEVPASGGSEWMMFLPGGTGSPASDAGEWLLALSPEDGGLRARYPLPSVPAPRIVKNGAPTPAAPWRPAWAVAGASDLVTRVYLADLHGQIHRLRLTDPAAREWEVAHRLGGTHPVLAPPVVFPFPGRTEPHLLVVTGGDRRVRDTPAAVVLLRDLGTHLEELWRQPLGEGEAPIGKPAVVMDASDVAVVLATHSIQTRQVSCDVTTSGDGVARLRAFSGLTGAALAGVVDDSSAVVSFGPGRIQGISLSASGNMAFSVGSAAGEAIDAVIGDFKFRVREGALEDVTLFVEGFRRSPFWIR